MCRLGGGSIQHQEELAKSMAQLSWPAYVYQLSGLINMKRGGSNSIKAKKNVEFAIYLR